ncbi:MAG: serine/threonine protein kinase [Spirochaetales bacterium]|nr:serine/threonine protein kinase [Spirochaetales bacterium]
MEFEKLSPDVVIDCVQKHLGVELKNIVDTYSSYINRVFGLSDFDGNRYIVKFYRGGRWNPLALAGEHLFLSDLAKAEIPVVAPIPNCDGRTLSICSGLFFALFPFRSGRLFEINCDEDWVRVGSLIGRMHTVALTRSADHRLIYTPSELTCVQLQAILDSEIIPEELEDEFADLNNEILDIIEPLFEGVTLQRIHGDCHRANILDRASEGLMLIDFDDMCSGPAIQDLWLLLPELYCDARREFNLLLEGYTQFCKFDYSTIKLIEPLRYMRIIYFLSWCISQQHDSSFEKNFPGFGTRVFWEKELHDLRQQKEIIIDHLELTNNSFTF